MCHLNFEIYEMCVFSCNLISNVTRAFKFYVHKTVKYLQLKQEDNVIISNQSQILSIWTIKNNLPTEFYQ